MELDGFNYAAQSVSFKLTYLLVALPVWFAITSVLDFLSDLRRKHFGLPDSTDVSAFDADPRALAIYTGLRELGHKQFRGWQRVALAIVILGILIA